jgi:hypothetical protein
LRALHERPKADVSEALVAQSRHDLMRAVYREDRGRATRNSSSWWERLERGFAASMRPAWQPAAALALVVVGFYVGRATDGGGLLNSGRPRVSEASFLPLPASGGEIQSVQMNSDQDRVEIVVEEVMRRTISGSPRDPQIRSLLISTVKEYPSSGVRLDSLNVLTERVQDRDVRQALTAAMVEDDNPGVRLRALAALEAFQDDPAVKSALIRVLQQDRNPGMRVHAIEILTESPDRELVGLLQGVVRTEPNNYVRLRCQRTLQALNASVETY